MIIEVNDFYNILTTLDCCVEVRISIGYYNEDGTLFYENGEDEWTFKGYASDVPFYYLNPAKFRIATPGEATKLSDGNVDNAVCIGVSKNEHGVYFPFLDITLMRT